MSAPFPSRRAAERGAILGFVIGTLALTATFGLRTAVFQMEYSAGSDQLRLLAVHGMAECVMALVFGFLAMLPRRAGISTAILVLAALAITVAKLMFMAVLIAIGEPDPWSYSRGIFALSAVVSLPLILSFLPVAGAVFTARASNAHDGALQVRATLCVWLAAAGFATVVLGPDLVVRAWGLIVVGGAALHVAIGAADERRLLDWARGAVARGAPMYFIENEAPKADVPPVYAGGRTKGHHPRRRRGRRLLPSRPVQAAYRGGGPGGIEPAAAFRRSYPADRRNTARSHADRHCDWLERAPPGRYAASGRRHRLRALPSQTL